MSNVKFNIEALEGCHFPGPDAPMQVERFLVGGSFCGTVWPVPRESLPHGMWLGTEENVKHGAAFYTHLIKQILSYHKYKRSPAVLKSLRQLDQGIVFCQDANK